MTYFKINSIYKRNMTETDPVTGELKFVDKGKSGNKLILGNFACEEFNNIKRWRVDEKIDGTNIRIMYREGEVSFGGRTDSAQIPAHLYNYLSKTFTIDKLDKAFPREGETMEFPNVTIFGEGYGPKIQEPMGSNYRQDVSFICFDIKILNWWIDRGYVRHLCGELGIDCVPEIGIMTNEEIFDFVGTLPLSRISKVPQMMEGVICRPEPLVLFRNQNPLIFKLKCKDIIKLKDTA